MTKEQRIKIMELVEKINDAQVVEYNSRENLMKCRMNLQNYLNSIEEKPNEEIRKDRFIFQENTWADK